MQELLAGISIIIVEPLVVAFAIIVESPLAIALLLYLLFLIYACDFKDIPAQSITATVIAEIVYISVCIYFEKGFFFELVWVVIIGAVCTFYLDKQYWIHMKKLKQAEQNNQTPARTTSTRTASTSRTYASTPSPTPSAPVLRRSDAPDITISGVRVITKETVSLFPNLRNLTIGSGVQEIAKSAFMAHPTLYSVTFASDINTVGESAFEDCPRLTRIHGITRVREIGDMAFNGCHALESVGCDIHTSVLTSIGEAAFGGCRVLKAFEFPESLRTIGRAAFVLCEALKFVSLPKSLKVIEEQTFSKCKSLESVSFATGITHIGVWAFSYCTSLTSVSFNKGLTHIGECAFTQCKSLTSVSFSKGLTHIDVKAFCNCGITSLDIPDTVVSIGREAFHLNNLQTLSIPNSVTDIGDKALWIDRNNLNYIKMPARFKERAPQIISFYEILSPSDIAAKITFFDKSEEIIPKASVATNSGNVTPASSISLNPEVFRYGGRDRDLYMNACWHDGKVYCGKTPSPDRIIGYYDAKKAQINCLENEQIGRLSTHGFGIDIWFSTSAIDLRMLMAGKRTTSDPKGNLAEIIDAKPSKFNRISDIQNPICWLANWQGDPWGACAAFVCLIYEMHRGEIDSKYSRFYTDYINSFH